MDGRLFIYHQQKGLPAFLSGPALHGRGKKAALIFVAGLGENGFLGVPYLPYLQKELEDKLGWNLVQVFLTSSHTGYGTGSVQRDAEELGVLIDYLCQELSFETIAVLGFSTGCQDTVQLLKNPNHAKSVKAIILQAPVSDREYMQTLPHTTRFLELAQSMLQAGKQEELMPRTAFPHPITAYRYHSLAAKGGDDDMFSSDFTDEELKEKLGHISVPTAIVISLNDEFVPPHVNSKQLAERFVAAIGHNKCEVLCLEGAHHTIDSQPQISNFVAFVVNFLGNYA